MIQNYKAHGQITLQDRLRQASDEFLKEAERLAAEEDKRGVFIRNLASLMFAAFEVEALINTVGWKLLQSRWVERSGWEEKVRAIYEARAMTPELGRRPLQTVKKLMDLRDGWVHAKPEAVNVEVQIGREVLLTRSLESFTSNLETLVTLEFARQCRSAVEEFRAHLLQISGIEWTDIITHGIETGLF